MYKVHSFFAPNYGNWPWMSLVWKNCFIPKHKFYVWLFAHRKFLTRDRQLYVVEKKCILCGNFNECFDYLFFRCNFSNSLWNKVREWLGMNKLWALIEHYLRLSEGFIEGLPPWQRCGSWLWQLSSFTF